MKKISLLFIIFAIVLIVNASVISFNLMYPEQPSIYVANQTITSILDLLNIYLHPKLFHANISFFRPSGHFLIYQLIVPFIGWHNTQAMLVINFIFLALIGYFLIQLYSLLFPNYKIGAYIAFSIYLMHPALSLARFTIMHFEFAYVFFLIVSFYSFVKFCQSKYQSYFYFIVSLLLYIIAVTFKEPALMLGPVCMCYFWIDTYDQTIIKTFKNNFLNPNRIFIMSVMTLTSLCLALYMLSAWPRLMYATTYMSIPHTLGTINAFLKDVFALTQDYIPAGYLAFADLAWRTLVFPPASRLLIWIFGWITLFSVIHICLHSSSKNFVFRKSFLFLFIASILFLILPFGWGMGGPWHYSLTILFLSLAAGFSVEYICQSYIKRKTLSYMIASLTVIGVTTTAMTVNHANIDKYATVKHGPLALDLNRNAVLNPPNIKEKLNKDSLLVIEDSRLHNDYMLGNSAYPFFLFLSEGEYDIVVKRQQMYFLGFHHTYSGTLFRYAYLIPTLREELFPFQVEQMNEVANEVIYAWLQNYNNIFCLGYDAHGNWIDKTELFRKNLLKEKSERDLRVYAYQEKLTSVFNKQSLYTHTLTVPDVRLCQFTCDQDSQCKNFIFNDSTKQCHFYGVHYTPSNKSCVNCKQFIRIERYVD